MLVQRVAAIRDLLNSMAGFAWERQEAHARRCWARVQTELVSLVQLGDYEAMERTSAEALDLFVTLLGQNPSDGLKDLLQKSSSVMGFLGLCGARFKADEALLYVVEGRGRGREVLEAIRDCSPIRQGTLAMHLGVHTRRLSDMMNPLVELGLAVRVTDGKNVYFNISSTGVKVLARLGRPTTEGALWAEVIPAVKILSSERLPLSEIVTFLRESETFTGEDAKRLKSNWRAVCEALKAIGGSDAEGEALEETTPALCALLLRDNPILSDQCEKDVAYFEEALGAIAE